MSLVEHLIPLCVNIVKRNYFRMIVYSNNKQKFLEDVLEGGIEEKIGKTIKK
jgi:hypothetical protein